MSEKWEQLPFSLQLPYLSLDPDQILYHLPMMILTEWYLHMPISKTVKIISIHPLLDF